MNSTIRNKSLVFCSSLISKIYSVSCYLFQHFSFLYKTSAPLNMYIVYFSTFLRNRQLREKSKESQTEFQKLIKNGNFSNDWFSENVFQWLVIFQKFNFFEKKLFALEIGSWEGMSGLFMLHTLPKAELTCVDTWQGSDEHKGENILNKIEQHFDTNLSAYKDRIKKFKGTSLSFFNTFSPKNYFDFIYIDGAHHCNDVLIDAVKGFEKLKVGGIMIFDDYFWQYYNKPIDNPAGAINIFLKLKKGSYKLLSVSLQVIILKTKDN